MENKKILYSLIVLLVIVSGLGGYKHIQYNKHNSFKYVSTHQDKTTKQLFSDFEKGETKKIVVVLHKDTCPSCHKWQYGINNSLSKSGLPKGYINATKGLPAYFTNKIAFADYENAKTPYVYVFENKSFKPTFEKRVNSKKNLKEMGEATK